jgi:hypothetical protein
MNQIIIVGIVSVIVTIVAVLIIAPNMVYVITRSPYYELRFYKDGHFVKKKFKKQSTPELTFTVMGVGEFAYPRGREEYFIRGICKEVYYDVISATPMVDKKNPPKISLNDLYEEELLPEEKSERERLQRKIQAKVFTNFMNPKTLREIQKSTSIKKVIAQPMSSLENMKGIIILAIIAVFGIVVLYMII